MICDLVFHNHTCLRGSNVVCHPESCGSKETSLAVIRGGYQSWPMWNASEGNGASPLGPFCAATQSGIEQKAQTEYGAFMNVVHPADSGHVDASMFTNG